MKKSRNYQRTVNCLKIFVELCLLIVSGVHHYGIFHDFQLLAPGLGVGRMRTQNISAVEEGEVNEGIQGE